MVFQSAGGQPLCNIRADGNLAGFAAIVQAILAVYILWLVMEAAEAYPTAATLETRDAHHHALQTGLGGILGEIFCHGSLPLSEHKKQGPHLYTYSADVAPVLPISHIHLWFLLLSLLQPVRQVWDSVFDLCPCSLQGFELAIFQLRTFIQQVVCGPVQLGSFLQ